MNNKDIIIQHINRLVTLNVLSPQYNSILMDAADIIDEMVYCQECEYADFRKTGQPKCNKFDMGGYGCYCAKGERVHG